MTNTMEQIYEKILHALQPGNQITLNTPEIPGVSFLIFVSERCDVLSITTEVAQNPSSIRIGISSIKELPLDKMIQNFDATIAVNIYGTHYQEIMLPRDPAQPENNSIATFRLCMQFVEGFLPILERFVDEVLSIKVIEIHNKAVQMRSW